jgi:hypothetical protein
MGFKEFLKVLVCTAFKNAFIIDFGLMAFAKFIFNLSLKIQVDNGHISAFDVVVDCFLGHLEFRVIHEDHSRRLALTDERRDNLIKHLEVFLGGIDTFS